MAADGRIAHPCLASSPALALWRAPTDNDRIGRFAAAWRDAGIDRLERRLVSLERDGDTVRIVDAVTTGAGIAIRHERIVVAGEDGGFAVTETVTIPDSIADLARVGVALEVVPGLESVEYFGRGPHETYPDRKRGGIVGRWSSTVTEQHVPYIRPQENGGHADVRWLELTDADGAGVRLELDRPGQVSVSHHRARRPRHRDPRTRAGAPRRDLRPPRRRPPWARDGIVRAGHPAGVPRRSGHLHLDLAPPAGRRRPVTIEWRPDDRQFHLANGRLSLVLRVYEDGSLGQLHLGAALPLGRAYRHLGPDPFDGFANRVGESVPLAYPTAGTGDFRVPALVVRAPDGATALALRYRDHAIAAGKPDLEGLPSTYVEADAEAETLTVTLADEVARIEVDVRFTLFRDHDAIARSATVRAMGPAAVELRTAMSASLDIPDANWRMIGLTGAWAREAHVAERPLVPGRHAVSSSRGASGRAAQPVHRPPPADRPTRRTGRRTGSASSTRATSSPRPRSTPSAPRVSGSASSPTPSRGHSSRGSRSRRPRP